MTVNFVNRGTSEELTIEEISGIAFIYNQVTVRYMADLLLFTVNEILSGRKPSAVNK